MFSVTMSALQNQGAIRISHVAANSYKMKVAKSRIQNSGKDCPQNMNDIANDLRDQVTASRYNFEVPAA